MEHDTGEGPGGDATDMIQKKDLDGMTIDTEEEPVEIF